MRQAACILLLRPVPTPRSAGSNLCAEVFSTMPAFSKLYQYAPIAFLILSLSSFLAAQEHDPGNAPIHFSAASLCGNYGAVAVYGANVARALGFEVMDGHGKITGAA